MAHLASLASHFKVQGDPLVDSPLVPGFRDQGTYFPLLMGLITHYAILESFLISKKTF